MPSRYPIYSKPFWLTPDSQTPTPLVLTVVLNICVFVPQANCDRVPNPLGILRGVTVWEVREEGREKIADITSTFGQESEIQTETQDVAYPTFSLAVPVSKHPVISDTGTGTVTPTPEYIYTTPTPTLTSSPFATPFAAPTYALASVSASISASTFVLNTTTISNNDCLDLILSPTGSKSNADSSALLMTLTILLGILLSLIVIVFFGVWVFRFRFRFGFGFLGRSELTTDGGDGQFSFNTNTESAVDRIESGVASRDVDIDIEDRKYAFGVGGPGVVPVLASEV